MLSYAQSTGGYLVAEGVETASELATLVEMGVPLVQGYYLGRPGEPWPESKGDLIVHKSAAPVVSVAA